MGGGEGARSAILQHVARREGGAGKVYLMMLDSPKLKASSGMSRLRESQAVWGSGASSCEAVPRRSVRCEFLLLTTPPNGTSLAVCVRGFTLPSRVRLNCSLAVVEHEKGEFIDVSNSLPFAGSSTIYGVQPETGTCSLSALCVGYIARDARTWYLK